MSHILKAKKVETVWLGGGLMQFELYRTKLELMSISNLHFHKHAPLFIGNFLERIRSSQVESFISP